MRTRTKAAEKRRLDKKLREQEQRVLDQLAVRVQIRYNECPSGLPGLATLKVAAWPPGWQRMTASEQREWFQAVCERRSLIPKNAVVVGATLDAGNC